MKNLLIAILLLSVQLVGQNIPLPSKCYPLNGGEAIDVMTGQKVEMDKTRGTCTDRFGGAGRAITFSSEDIAIEIPILSKKNLQKGLTITYWMYLSQDSLSQAFWGKDKDGNVLLGMYKNGNRAVLNMYHRDIHQNILQDQQWMWDDSNFSAGKGWYFVAITYALNGTYFYLFDPTAKMTECYSSFIPDWDLIASWGIGFTSGISGTTLDDFKVYTQSLTKEQVDVLYQSESKISLGNNSWINLHTSKPLLTTEWYTYCIGKEGNHWKYAMQSQSDLSFLALEGINLLTVPLVSDGEAWTLSSEGDIAEGRIFKIADWSTGLNVTDLSESVTLQVADNSNRQKWCIKVASVKEDSYRNFQQEKEHTDGDVYFDRGEKVIRVNVVLPEVGDVKVTSYDSSGRVTEEFAVPNVSSLNQVLHPKSTGVYTVSIQANGYRLNKKVLVNF